MIEFIVSKDIRWPDDWRVEEKRTNNEGGRVLSIALFSGPNAELRAREYATWMNAPHLYKYE